MNVKLIAIENDSVVRLACQGPLIGNELSVEGEHPFLTLMGERWPSSRVVLDMGQADYLDSSAIGWLISSQKQFQQNGGMLLMHSVPSNVRQMFDLLKLGAMLHLIDHEDEAMQMARGSHDHA